MKRSNVKNVCACGKVSFPGRFPQGTNIDTMSDRTVTQPTESYQIISIEAS